MPETKTRFSEAIQYHETSKSSKFPANSGVMELAEQRLHPWLTYRRRKPVRYIRRLRASVCQVCGLARSLDNPLQSAHIIGFDLGVIELGLTPEFLDSDENIVTAHRRTCNKVSELSLNESMMRLRDLGVEDVPLFLSAAVRESWVRLITNEKRE